MRLIDSGRSSLRRSIRTFWESQTRCAMSVAVTEPKSVPVSPAGTSKRISSASSRRTISWACSKLCALRGRRRLGELARQQIVAREPRSDVDDLAAQADLLDVLSQDDLHRQPVE